MRTSYKGFTLFEILLAMLLMAIIAVSVLPGITKNAEQQVFVTQLKVVQNDLKQAMLIISAKNRNDLSRVFSNPIYLESNPRWPKRSNPTDETRNNFIFTLAIRSVLDANCVYFNNVNEDSTGNVISNPNTQAELFANRNPHFITGKDAGNQLYDQNNVNGNWSQPANFAAINLKSGATVRPIITDRACPNNLCGALEVDLNGTKKPNVVGKDIHFFWIVNTDDGIVPWGEDSAYDDSVGSVLTNHAISHASNGDQCKLTGKSFASVDDSLGCTYNVLRDGKFTYY